VVKGQGHDQTECYNVGGVCFMSLTCFITNLPAKREAEVAGSLRSTKKYPTVRVRIIHPDTKTLLFHIRFLIFSDTFTLVCLSIFIV